MVKDIKETMADFKKRLQDTSVPLKRDDLNISY